MSIDLNYIEVTPKIIMTAMRTEETNELIRPYMYSNISCIVHPEGLVFVNCTPFSDIAVKFRKDMEARTGQKASKLILTSHRWDSMWGMSAFKDLEIISSSQTKSGIRTNLKKGVDVSYREWIIRQIPEDNKLHDSLLNNEIIIPTTGFSRTKSLGGNSTYPLELEVISAGEISIFSPMEKVLFSGSVIQSSMPPFMWPITGVNLYRKWEEMEIEKIIPSRGPVVNKAYIIQIRKWMEEFLDRLREYRDQEIPESQITKQEFPSHPAKSRKSWIEGGPYHTEIVDRLTRYWYKQILREVKQEEDDLMFIS